MGLSYTRPNMEIFTATNMKEAVEFCDKWDDSIYSQDKGESVIIDTMNTNGYESAIKWLEEYEDESIVDWLESNEWNGWEEWEIEESQ